MSAVNDRLASALADRYRFERELGQGGMATVYLAADLKHDRNVAIKVLKPELAAVLGAERFVQEIKTTAALSHPHILPLFDSGEAGGFLYYVMPYIEGETIRDRLNRETQLGVEEAVRITVEVADALDYAHRHGVIHRDIKPENLLLHDGRAMVMDFGIALAVSAAAGGRMTETGLSLGTPHYMSPEQATADKEITARSDVYSLASVLYEMLASVPPHEGGSAQQVIMRIIADTPRPVTELRKSVPPNVADALAKALEKLPADRFASAKEFTTALEDPAFRTGPGAIGGGAIQAGDRRLLFGAIAAALVATGAAIFGWTRGRDAPVRPLAYEIALPAGEADATFLPIAVRVAPHGNALVYWDSTGGTKQLWIKERGVVAPRIIPGTVDAYSPTLSPDGTQVAFVSHGRVMRLPIAGGAATTVSDSSIPDLALPGAWLDDGALVLTNRTMVVVLPPGGGPPRRIATMDSLGVAIFQLSPVPGRRAFLMAGCTLVGCSNPQVFLVRLDPLAILPLVTGAPTAWALEGDRIVYVLGNGTMFVASLDVDRAAVGRPAQLPGSVTMSGFGAALVMSRDGVMLYASGGGPPPSTKIELVSLGPGHPPEALRAAGSLEVDNNSDIDVSPDGRSVLLSVPAGATGSYVVIRSLETGASTRFTTDGTNNIRAKWSPDGRRILWISDRRNGHFEAWWRAADGTGEPELLASEPRDIYEVTLSRDGQWLVYRTDDVAPGAGDIYARRLTGDTTTIAIAATPAEETSPEVSPDGRWIAYAERIGERKEVIVRSFPDPSRSRIQVSTGGASQPRWSLDGRRLIYRTQDREAIVFASLAAEGAFRVVGETRVPTAADRYLNNDDEQQWGLMPNGRDVLLARRVDADAPPTSPERLILEEHTIPAPGRPR